MRVQDTRGNELGTIGEVVADEGLDVFRGLVLKRSGWNGDNLFVPAELLVAVDGDVASLLVGPGDLDRLEKVRAPHAGEERGADFTPVSPDA